MNQEAMDQAKKERAERFLHWKTQPVTREFFSLLTKWRMGLMEQWAAGSFDDDSNLHSLGRVSQLNDLIDIDAEQLQDGIYEE